MKVLLNSFRLSSHTLIFSHRLERLEPPGLEIATQGHQGKQNLSISLKLSAENCIHVKLDE